MPKEFSWTNANGTDYVGEVLDQADCGSCYIVSTTRMLSARHRARDAAVAVASAVERGSGVFSGHSKTRAHFGVDTPVGQFWTRRGVL